MPDSLPAPRGLKMSAPVITRELLPARRSSLEGFRPATLTSEMASLDTISLPSPRPNTRAKAREQPIRAVLNRENPKGASLTDVKPATPRVVLAPVSLKRVNVHAVTFSLNPAKPPVRSKVSVERQTRAIVHSPMPKAALTLPKSTPVCSIRAPASSAKDGTIPSPSPCVIPTQRVDNAISTRRVTSTTTRHKVETPSRVSQRPSSLRFGEIPSADGIERSDEHSNAIIGPAIEQALAPFSSEVGEGQRAPDSVVSIHNEETEDRHTPSHLAAFTLPASAPTTPSVHPAHVISRRQLPVDPIPPVEVISRRRSLYVVNKASLASVAHLPSLETARKQSRPSSTLLRGEGGGQLARAAAYIRERSTQRSSALDEFVRRTPKAPPDKMAESVNLRHLHNVVSEKEKASTSMCSPEYMAVEPSLSQSEAPREKELSTELSEPVWTSAEPRRDTSGYGIRESDSVPSAGATEGDRCLNNEHLVVETVEVSVEPVKPALIEVVQPLCVDKRLPEPLVVSKIEASAFLRSPITSVALTSSVSKSSRRTGKKTETGPNWTDL